MPPALRVYRTNALPTGRQSGSARRMKLFGQPNSNEPSKERAYKRGFLTFFMWYRATVSLAPYGP